MSSKIDVTKQYEEVLAQYKTMQSKAYSTQNVGENGDKSLTDLKAKLTSFVDAYSKDDAVKAKLTHTLDEMQTTVNSKIKGGKADQSGAWADATQDMEALLTSLKTSSGAQSTESVWTPAGTPAASGTSAPAASGNKATASGSVAVPKVAITNTVNVSTAAELKAALASAKSGTEIKLAAGTYAGPIKMTGLDGVTISGSADAVIETGPKGSSLAMTDCNNCTLTGISIKGGQKSLMADGSSNNVFDNLDVSGSQMEGLHLRKNSSDNVIQNSSIHDTGKGGDTAAGNGRTQAMDGEGIYIGTAKSNGEGDASNNNAIIGNHIYNTTAENIDIKEYTSGGVIKGNTLDGSQAGSGAKANVQIKGSNYTATGNTVLNKTLGGIISTKISGADQSGLNNTIVDNG